MGAGLAVYRGLTWGLGLVLPAAAGLGRADGAWRGALTGASAEGAASAGSIWVHAASMGEVGAARRWVDALVEAGVRPPLLLTTRTRTGLERARREMPGRVAARIAPLDLPQTVRALLESACPSRLDVVETEVWPNLILEARRARVAVVFVSGTVSARTERRLRALGVAGPALLGNGVFALARDDEAAARFRALGIPEARVRVAGDLKADFPSPAAVPAEGERVAVVFGSFRPGEEATALAIAEALHGMGVEEGRPATPPARPLLVVAPRHEEGAARARRLFAGAGYAVFERGAAERSVETLPAWLSRAASGARTRVAILSTHGELPEAYDHARVAIVGGTFAPFGGHTPLEAASRGCPVIAGPYHDAVARALGAIARDGGAAIAPDPASAAAVAASWWRDGGFAARSQAALRAARSLGGAARRGLEALEAWRLVP
ncbi:MAG TPA: glycosyltransferase N-terminal domain-containing protein [Candidatus Binatia bacterium]|nr:glycosyltransferase N-terminal domain-containing protein [Candidatus Binatia bacterium]